MQLSACQPALPPSKEAERDRGRSQSAATHAGDASPPLGGWGTGGWGPANDVGRRRAVDVDALGPQSGPAASGCSAAAILGFASSRARPLATHSALPLPRFAPGCGPRPPETPPPPPLPPREGPGLWWSGAARPRTDASFPAGMDGTAAATASVGRQAVRCGARGGSRRPRGPLCRRGDRPAVPTRWLGKAEAV